MGKNHIKRLSAPTTWPISRKINTWIARPSTSTHQVDSCISLSVLVKEVLKVCKTSKEVKYILSKDKIKIDGIVRKDKNFPTGLMDVVDIDGKFYRMMFNKKGKILPLEIKKDEATIKPRKVVNKTNIKGKKLQLNLFDGSNLLYSKKDINTYDTLVFSKGKLKEKIDFKEGNFVYITGGKQIGKSGILKKIEKTRGLQPKKIIFNDGKKDFETLKDYAYIVGKNKPIITLPNE